jgi:hypothetical protein
MVRRSQMLARWNASRRATQAKWLGFLRQTMKTPPRATRFEPHGTLTFGRQALLADKTFSAKWDYCCTPWGCYPTGLRVRRLGLAGLSSVHFGFPAWNTRHWMENLPGTTLHEKHLCLLLNSDSTRSKQGRWLHRCLRQTTASVTSLAQTGWHFCSDWNGSSGTCSSRAYWNSASGHALVEFSAGCH